MALVYPDRRPFIFGCVTAATMEILAVWIPRSAALGLAIFIARLVDYIWLGKYETTLAAWLLKTVMFSLTAIALSLALQGIQSWYMSGN